MAVWVFGVLNILFGCYFLVRIVHSWSKIIAEYYKSPEKIIEIWIPPLLFVVSVGLTIWLIVLGIDLLKMKRWARRGSVLFAWINVVFIVITLVSIVVSMIINWNLEVIRASMNIGNALVLIQWIYMVLLLIFMKTKKVKQAFAFVGG